MTIATYAELSTEIASLTHREGDTDFTGKVALFVRLLEARLNRELRVKEMQATLASTTLTSGAATLPAGFLAFVEVRFDSSPSYTLHPRALEWIRAQDSTATGNATDFAITGTEVICWPPTGPIKGTYYTEIPGLETNSSNWLLTKYPDLYLFGSLVEAALWAQDDAALAKWAPRASALIEAANSADQRDQFDGGILAVQAR